MDRLAFQSACKSLGLELSEDQIEAFERFEDALYGANEKTNLTRVPKDECWLRHFIDSLLLSEFVPTGSKILDIGTGPGFPAWPLACARPDLQVLGLDSNGKMLGFLQTQPLPNLRVQQMRAEENPAREKYDVVTGRAVAPLAVQLEISAAPCKVGGFVLPMRTPNDHPFVTPPGALGLELVETFERSLPGDGVTRLFPKYLKIRATERGYPRRWSEIKRLIISSPQPAF